MEDKLVIKNYKCFLDIAVPLNNLTVLAGGNSVGKSSVIQCILLLRRAWEKLHSDIDRVPLNGKYNLGLGNSIEVLTWNAPSDIISLSFTFKGYTEEIKFFANSAGEPEVYLHIVYPETPSAAFFLSSENPITKPNLHYLHAERLGPRPFHGVTEQIRNVGSQGEFTISLLSSNSAKTKELDVPETRMVRNTTNQNLISQAEAWMNTIIPGIDILPPQKIQEINQAYIQYGRANPYNVGFGISYVLPIIVSGLIAKEGEMLVVENPEAHLHPSGQSAIGKFLATIAASGVQVVVETHSEHVINGVRIASIEDRISPQDVIINFFSAPDDPNAIQPDLSSIRLDSNSDLGIWPKGFFDQQQLDIARIFKLRKQKKQ